MARKSSVQDTKLFETILGLQAPWRISRVAPDTATQRVDLWVDHAADVRRTCPECAADLACRDHADERVWRHLDICQFQTFLHARVPRVECPTHGIRQVRVPRAEVRSRFTLLMERTQAGREQARLPQRRFSVARLSQKRADRLGDAPEFRVAATRGFFATLARRSTQMPFDSPRPFVT